MLLLVTNPVLVLIVVDTVEEGRLFRLWAGQVKSLGLVVVNWIRFCSERGRSCKVTVLICVGLRWWFLRLNSVREFVPECL